MTVASVGPALTDRVAEEILALLGRRRMSQAELARRLEQKPMWMSDRLRGVQQIGLNDLQRIAEALGVDVHDLIPGTQRPTVGMETSAQPASPSRRPAGRPRDNRPRARANVHHSLVRPHALPRPANKRSTDRHHPYNRRNALVNGDTVSHE